jgi:hypothetical protein
MLVRFSKWVRAIARYHRARQMLHYRGNILTLWAVIESNIDQANFCAWSLTSGTTSKVVPQSFRWKVELFAKLHSRVAPFLGLKAMADEIIALLEAQKDFRHLMAHGVYLASKPRWHFKMNVFEKDGSLGIITTVVTKAEFESRGDELLNIAKKVIRYGDALDGKLRQHSENNQP